MMTARAMEFHIFALLLTITILARNASGENTCQSDKCYRNVNTTHASLTKILGRFRDTVSTSKFPTFPDYERIDKITKQYKRIWNEAGKKMIEFKNSTLIVKQCFDNYTTNRQIFVNILKSLDEINKMYGDVTSLNGILHNLKDLFVGMVKVLDANLNASEGCKNMETERLKLEEFVEQTFKELEAMKKKFENLKKRIRANNKDVKEIYEKTVGDESSFNSLKIPDGAVAAYLKEVDVKFGSSLDKLRENVAIIDNLLQAMFTGQSDSLGDQIAKTRKLIDELQAILESFEADLRAYNDAVLKVDFTSIINDDMLDLIQNLKNELEKLEEKHKTFVKNLENYRKDLEDIKIRIPILRQTIENIDIETEKLKEYNMIAKFLLLSKTRIASIKHEIDKSKRTMRLLKMKMDLENELEHIKAIYDELMRTEKKCPTNVEFEN